MRWLSIAPDRIRNRCRVRAHPTPCITPNETPDIRVPADPDLGFRHHGVHRVPHGVFNPEIRPVIHRLEIRQTTYDPGSGCFFRNRGGVILGAVFLTWKQYRNHDVASFDTVGYTVGYTVPPTMGGIGSDSEIRPMPPTVGGTEREGT